MTRTLAPLDISNKPDLLALVAEVRETGSARVLRRGEDVAIIVPMEPSREYPWREKSEADYEAFRSAAGGWRGNIDVEQFLKDNAESRQFSGQPPVKL